MAYKSKRCKAFYAALATPYVGEELEEIREERRSEAKAFRDAGIHLAHATEPAVVAAGPVHPFALELGISASHQRLQRPHSQVLADM